MKVVATAVMAVYSIQQIRVKAGKVLTKVCLPGFILPHYWFIKMSFMQVPISVLYSSWLLESNYRKCFFVLKIWLIRYYSQWINANSIVKFFVKNWVRKFRQNRLCPPVVRMKDDNCLPSVVPTKNGSVIQINLVCSPFLASVVLSTARRRTIRSSMTQRTSEKYFFNYEELCKTNLLPWMLVEYGWHETAHYDLVV